ncbi:MAG: RNA methyltransferase [Bacillota bacterium]|nr:RNA methyltransferase [Bacillota bacterium]
MRTIQSTDNQTIKLVNKLKTKKHRNEQGLFFVEGLRLVEEFVGRPKLVKALFVETSLLDSMKELVEPLDDRCFQIDARLMKQICSTQTPQGLAAIVEKPRWDFNDVFKRDGMIVILDKVSDPGNMGSILRTCWALDVNGVLLSSGCVDPFSPKVVRSTMGGILNVPLFQDAGSREWKSLKEADFQFVGTNVQADHNYFEMDLKGKCALVMGNEAFGVGQELTMCCDQFIKIPMNANVDSLNVAAACAIIISESSRQRYGGLILS